MLFKQTGPLLSRSTLKRDLAYLSTRLNNPIEWSREAGGYRLRIPYTDHRELIMDILKHGAHCEVLGPAGLRKLVGEEVERMGAKYL